MAFIIVLIIIIVAVLGFGIAQYNGLVSLRNKLQEAWRQVDVELNRRYDLIPNLVSTVQGAAKFEQSTLEQVIGLRNQAKALAGGDATQQRGEIEGQLTRAVSNILVTAEAYPELKSNASFQQLQSQLSETEDRIANSRRYYNAVVGDYNTKTEAFPSNLFANAFHFVKAGYFEVDDPTVRQAPQVDFQQLNGTTSLPPAPAPAPAPTIDFSQPQTGQPQPPTA